MKLKMTQNELENHIKDCVMSEVYHHLTQELYNLYDRPSQLDMNKLISNMIAEGVAKGFQVFFREIYTDEDFERDMGFTK